jgi:hypothetical protein
MDDFDDRKRQTETVLGWIEESQGSKVASDWAWGTTPIPCGLPSDKMLDEGLRVATGELSIWALLSQVEQEIKEDMAAYNEAQSSKENT